MDTGDEHQESSTESAEQPSSADEDVYTPDFSRPRRGRPPGSRNRTTTTRPSRPTIAIAGPSEEAIRMAAAPALQGDLEMLAAGMAIQMPLPGVVLHNRAEVTGEALAEVLPISVLKYYVQGTKYKVIAQTVFMLVLAMGVQNGAIKPDSPMAAPIAKEIQFVIAMTRQAQEAAEAATAGNVHGGFPEGGVQSDREVESEYPGETG